MNPKKIKVNRTPEGTIFEFAFLVLLIAVWVFIIIALQKAPDIVPTHFDAAGRPNSYGSKFGILIPTIITTIAAASMMVCAYFPHKINMPTQITTPHQYELAIRMLRIMGLILLALTASIGYMSLVLGAHGAPSAVPILAVVGLLFVVIIVFTFLIYKAK